VANPAPQSLLTDGPNSSEPGSAEAHSSFKSEEEREQEVLKQRELEQELENERPCVFKSISPVGLSGVEAHMVLTKSRPGVMPI
jgi:hypothetical protein